MRRLERLRDSCAIEDERRVTRVLWLAQWPGRLLLVGAVAFWWAGFVVPRLISLVHPAWLAESDIPRWLNPDAEANVANSVSAAALGTAALLALANAATSRRRRAGRLEILGWTVLGAMAAGIAVEEIVELKTRLTEISDSMGHPALWPLVLAPLVVAFLLFMGVFVRRSLRAQSVRVPIALGLLAWLFGLSHEMGHPYFFSGRASGIGIVLEETLEFCGTLLIGYGAAAALQGSTAGDRGVFEGRWRLPLAMSAVAVAVVGGFVVLFIFRAPVVDLRGAPAYHVSLPDQWSVVQELRMPAAPISQIGLRASLGRPSNVRSKAVPWRILRGDESGEILREGRLEVVALDHLHGVIVEIAPPLAEPEGERVALQIVADVGPPATNAAFWHGLEIRAVKGLASTDGRLWVNGVPSWPDQSLEYVAYSAPEPTWSKLQAVGRTLTTDWKWAVLAVSLATALTLIAFVPLALLAAALPGWPSRRGGASEM